MTKSLICGNKCAIITGLGWHMVAVDWNEMTAPPRISRETAATIQQELRKLEVEKPCVLIGRYRKLWSMSHAMTGFLTSEDAVTRRRAERLEDRIFAYLNHKLKDLKAKSGYMDKIIGLFTHQEEAIRQARNIMREAFQIIFRSTNSHILTHADIVRERGILAARLARIQRERDLGVPRLAA